MPGGIFASWAGQLAFVGLPSGRPLRALRGADGDVENAAGGSVFGVTQEAIRVCGGRAFLKRYPLKRYARDARAAALMRPRTQEIAMQQAWEAALGLDGQRGAAEGA
jgi:alkylation response protein AidB-like acyl-CoA dehydrogenase